MKHYLKPLILLPISTFLVSCISFRMPPNESLFSYVIKFEREHENISLSDGTYSSAKYDELYFPHFSDYTESTEQIVNSWYEGYIDSVDSNPEKTNAFSKCTFYLCNYSYAPADCAIDISIAYSKGSEDCSNIIRVRLYENDGDYDNHDYFTFAKPRSDGTRERISDASSDYAVNFESDERVVYLGDSIMSHRMRRYTLVTWLEGEDPDAFGEAPTGNPFVVNVKIRQIH